ncbi:DNA-binding ferritin-like protein (oxidative damage protectant) [Halogranum amylolyticum]|uniref:DNA-binding ferritin-like protein (Oxidative damage protectant) n=1 Tax=Halogranum amylolyticum TaxID=660520 RepID=A0A1H8TJS2_9EURY|nr:DNA starvation/stationary phase protection protein DpsA [Halogranum amylolyticum]SEO91095.1 DNA-binding ferritin-like protein (oxidative damage protectant) [Halogranum amylolyticum]
MATKDGRLVREPDTGERRQAWGTVDGNELRVAHGDAETLVDALSVDHAGSFNLFYLLRKHYWTAEGAEHDEVADFLETAYSRVREINDDIAVRIVELGGIPPNTPPTIQEHADVHLEAEDLYDLRASLKGDLEGYATLITSVREHVELAERLCDDGTAERLQTHLVALEHDASDLEHLLEDDTLVRADDVEATHERRDSPSEHSDTSQADASHLRRLDPTHVRREWDTTAENALRLDQTAAGELVTALNTDLSGLYILFNQVRKHFWTTEGAERGQIGAFLEDAADRLSVVTDDLAIRVHALGGVPVCGPMGVRQHASMNIEAAHRYDVRSSLGRDLDGYATLVEQLREHVELSHRLGDEATSALLRVHLKMLEADANTLERYLADDTLVRRRSVD